MTVYFDEALVLYVVLLVDRSCDVALSAYLFYILKVLSDPPMSIICFRCVLLTDIFLRRRLSSLGPMVPSRITLVLFGSTLLVNTTRESVKTFVFFPADFPLFSLYRMFTYGGDSQRDLVFER